MKLDTQSRVERYEPKVGDDTREIEGIAENSKKVETKISELISVGYRIQSGNQFNYIVPAKVKIYIHKSEETNK